MDGGISLQFNEIETKIVLAQFLVEGVIKAVGNIDNTLNDERYNFVNIENPVTTPWSSFALTHRYLWSRMIVLSSAAILPYTPSVVARC